MANLRRRVQAGHLGFLAITAGALVICIFAASNTKSTAANSPVLDEVCACTEPEFAGAVVYNDSKFARLHFRPEACVALAGGIRGNPIPAAPRCDKPPTVDEEVPLASCGAALLGGHDAAISDELDAGDWSASGDASISLSSTLALTENGMAAVAQAGGGGELGGNLNAVATVSTSNYEAIAEATARVHVKGTAENEFLVEEFTICEERQVVVSAFLSDTSSCMILNSPNPIATATWKITQLPSGPVVESDTVAIFSTSDCDIECKSFILDEGDYEFSIDYDMEITIEAHATSIGSVSNSCIVSQLVKVDVEFSDECPADLNDDGVVNSRDLIVMLGEWGVCASAPPLACTLSCCVNCASDLNGDCVVNSLDLNVLLAAWGNCP